MVSSSSIELKVLSGQGLKVFNYFQKPVVFVQVSIATDDPDQKLDQHQKQTQRTTTVREDHGQPEWNQEMRFDLSDIAIGVEHLFLQFDLRHEGLVFGDKPIGEIRVPMTDLIDGFDGIVRFVSYEVRTPDGKPNGALNFSYKVNSKGRDLAPEMVAKVSGYPVVDKDQHSPPVTNPASISAGDQVVSREVLFSESSPPPPGAPIPSQLGHEVYYSQPLPLPPPNGYYQPSPPPHAAIHHHHHHHGPPPPPPQHRVHPRAADPRSYSGGYDYRPRKWGPGSVQWGSWNGR